MANTLTFANQTITDANIFGGINYLIDLNASEEFSIGNTASASVSFVTDIQLPLYSKDSTNGTFTWEKDEASRGRYYITEVTKEAGKYSITAYDAMSLLEAPVSNLSITYPATLSAFAASIAAYMGCTVSGTLNNGSLSVSELDELLPIRAVLGYIAEASGCSAKIDGSDHLCFMYYADSEVTVTASEYVSINVADYTCAAIDNVTIFNSIGEIQATAGTGTNSLFIGQNPFLEEATSTHAQTILSKVSGFTYAPLTCELFTDEGIEAGTIVTFGTTPTLVMHVESSESGAVASSVGSDVRANYNKSAIEIVGEARAIAVDAQAAAGMVSGILAGMEEAAEEAGTTLEGIYADATNAVQAADAAQTSADKASASASSAVSSANVALNHLGIVENVVGVLNLLQEHGDYEVTTDEDVIPDKWYFKKMDNGGYEVVNAPTSVYHLTEDTAIDSTKTYYTRTGTGTEEDPYIYTEVDNPVVADIGTYYEKYYELISVDEAVQNYVASHLVLSGNSLFLQTTGTGAMLELNTDNGVILYGTDGQPRAQYGDNAIIGSPEGFHIKIDGTNNKIGFYEGAETEAGQSEVAYMNSDALYVRNSLSFGSFIFYERENGHFTLKKID